MRQEEGQDRKIRNANQGKTAKDDGKHKGRNISRTTRINNIEHNNANIITDNIPSIITVIITKHVKRNITITNKENKQAQESRQKPTRHQRTHATDGTSIDSSGIGFIQEYEAGQEISVADVPQDNTSDDNAHGKKQESGEVPLEETRNHTAWDNQLKGCVTETRKRRHGKRNRKTTGKQLITYFLWTLEAPFNPASDTDAHLDISTIIFAIRKLQACKTKQDSNTRPRQNEQGQGTHQAQKGGEEGRLQKGEKPQYTLQRTRMHPSANTTKEKEQTKQQQNKHTKYETNKKMDKRNSIMEDQRKHPCQQQRTEHERMKHRIRQTVTAFLTTIIITIILLNTGNRNTAVRKQGVRTPQQQQEKCTHKQVNRDDKEDSRSMDNERNATGRTPQRSINNQHRPRQSNAREPLQITERTHGFKTKTTQALHKGKVNHRHSHHNHDHRHRKRSSKQHCHDNIRDIQQGSATQQGGHGQQDQNSNNNGTTEHRAAGVRNAHQTRNKDDETRQKRKRSRHQTPHRKGGKAIMYHSSTNGKLQAGKGTLSENGANTQKGNNETSSGTGKNTRNKVASIQAKKQNKKHQEEQHTNTSETQDGHQTPPWLRKEDCPKTEQRTDARSNKYKDVTTTRKKRGS
jgi:hypothetical protein